MSCLHMICFFVIAANCLHAQTEKWVYGYDGPGHSHDYANSVVYGADGNIYVAGKSLGSTTRNDFTVISLTPSGTQRWVYRKNGPLEDNAWAIAYGQDNNIYAAGYVSTSATAMDLTIVSLTPAGAQRWIYTHNGPMNSDDYAVSIIYGPDGNIYAAGKSGVTNHDVFVVSLTPSGTERWLYYYNGPANSLDVAYSIKYGPDGNLYVAGHGGGGSGRHFIVISLTTSGTERWVYDNGGANNWYSYAYSTAFDSDGNIYACGYLWTGTMSDFTVVKLDTSGTEQWIYQYNAPWSGYEGAYSIICGTDGNIYAAGSGTPASNVFTDLLVISLTTTGQERWVYYYGGPSNLNDGAESIVFGDNGNIYVTGYSTASSNSEDWDIVVLKMDTNGLLKWLYRFDGPGHFRDCGEEIVYGSDDNLYVAGYSYGANQDFTVLSIGPELGVEEKTTQSSIARSYYDVLPNPFASYASVLGHEEKCFCMFDVTGRQVGLYKGDRIGWDLGPGTYFLMPEDRSLQPMRVVKIK